MYGDLGKNRFESMYRSLEKWVGNISYAPIVDLMASAGDLPWRILVSTLLSSRTKDEVTAAASRRLFERAETIKDLSKMDEQEIEKLIYPVGFYRVKAKNLRKLAFKLLNDYEGEIPDNLDELTSLPGVGIKTATLVYIKAFDKYEICVDTHVHRISNLWGIVSTDTPENTRIELKKEIGKKYWKTINQYLVTLGQKVCTPIKRKCDQCPLKKSCPASEV